MIAVNFPHVNVVTERRKDGSVKRRFYYRPTRERLPDIDDPAFPAAYQAAKSRAESRVTAPAAGTMKALIAQYMAAPEYLEKAASTRKEYAKVIKRIEELIGDMPVTHLQRKHIMAIRNKFSETPRTANYILQLIRLLMSFAVDYGYRKDNPALRFKALKTGDGYKPWPEEAIRKFRAVAAEPERTPFEIALHTGQRLGDVLAMTEHQRVVDDGARWVKLTQGKTGAEVFIPEHPELTSYLDGRQRRDVLLSTSPTGRPWTRDHYEHRFRDTCTAAGITGLHFHGLRHTAAGRLAEAGCSDAEIQSITGHQTATMVQRYRRQANQRRLAGAAMKKLTGDG